MLKSGIKLLYSYISDLAWNGIESSRSSLGHPVLACLELRLRALGTSKTGLSGILSSVIRSIGGFSSVLPA